MHFEAFSRLLTSLACFALLRCAENGFELCAPASTSGWAAFNPGPSAAADRSHHKGRTCSSPQRTKSFAGDYNLWGPRTRGYLTKKGQLKAVETAMLNIFPDNRGSGVFPFRQRSWRGGRSQYSAVSAFTLSPSAGVNGYVDLYRTADVPEEFLMRVNRYYHRLDGALITRHGGQGSSQNQHQSGSLKQPDSNTANTAGTNSKTQRLHRAPVTPPELEKT